MRTLGMTMSKIPLFVWAVLFTAILLVMTLPVLSANLVKTLAEKNYTICWELLIYIDIIMWILIILIVLRQSAGNLEILQVFINIHISLLMVYFFNKLEILRDYKYKFISFFLNVLKEKRYKKNGLTNNILNLKKEENIENISVENLNLINLKDSKGLNNELGHYLAGLIEGDGCIIVPTSVRSKKNKLNYPSIQISFNEKDYPLAHSIMNALNLGYIVKKKDKKAYVYVISTFEGILKVVNLINGKFRTNKYKRLWLLINWLNNVDIDNYSLKNKLILKDLNLEKKGIDESNILSNSWLSGMLDADGHFYVSHRKLKNKNLHTSIYMRLSQSKLNSWKDDNKDIMERIGNALNINVKLVERDRIVRKSSEYSIRTTNIKSNTILVNYLNNYPLFSSKYLDYIDWCKVYNLYNPRLSHTPLNIEIIELAKENMNDKRTYFCWDHLNNFYTN